MALDIDIIDWLQRDKKRFKDELPPEFDPDEPLSFNALDEDLVIDMLSNFDAGVDAQRGLSQVKLRFGLAQVALNQKEFWGGDTERLSKTITLDILLLSKIGVKNKALINWVKVEEGLRYIEQNPTTFKDVLEFEQVGQSFARNPANNEQILGLQRYVVTTTAGYEILDHGTT